MEAALGTAVGTLQREWYWTRALDAGSGLGIRKGSAGRPWLVQARQWLSARLSDSVAQVGREAKF